MPPTIETVEADALQLPAEERARLIDRLITSLGRDWADWDAQLERDVKDGRLDALAEQALRDHVSGKTTAL